MKVNSHQSSSVSPDPTDTSQLHIQSRRMNSSPVSTLPPEILDQILKYLPIGTLLKFARTSRRNYPAAILALQHLHLAIFPKQLHGLLAFLSSSPFEEIGTGVRDTSYDDPCRNQVIATSPLPPFKAPRSRSKPTSPLPTPAQYRELHFQAQNALACSILSTPTLASLKSLSLYLYHINSPALAEIMATHLPDLRELRLKFYHPYLHDSCLPAQYWSNPLYLQPSILWNALAGIGNLNSAKLRLTRLERLALERAGINSFQLRRWIECNPSLKELRLSNVAGVDIEFVQWLGWYYGEGVLEKPDTPRPVHLRTLALDMCSALVVTGSDDLCWLDPLFGLGTNVFVDEDKARLQVLSFNSSKSVSAPALISYLESAPPALQQLTLPDGCVLLPRSPRGWRSGSTIQHSNSSDSHTTKKRPQNHIALLPLNNHEDSHGQSGVVVDIGEINIQGLSIHENEDDASSDGDDSDTTFSSPVSYLRLRNSRRPKKGSTLMFSDIIEPDPDAI